MIICSKPIYSLASYFFNLFINIAKIKTRVNLYDSPNIREEILAKGRQVIICYIRVNLFTPANLSDKKD